MKVRFYKTINGRDTMITAREFETIEAAMAAADEWEERSINNYAVYGG